VLLEGRAVTPDLGGTAHTTEMTAAIISKLPPIAAAGRT